MTKCKKTGCLKMVANAHNPGRSGFCRIHSIEKGFFNHTEKWKEQKAQQMEGNQHAKGNRHINGAMSKKHKKKISKRMIGINAGSKNNFWKGGITPIHKRIRSSAKYKNWRTTVLKRDNYKCVLCGDSNKKGRGKSIVLNADHIKSFASFPKLRFIINNGRTLCLKCHRETENYGRPNNKIKNKTICV